MIEEAVSGGWKEDMVGVGVFLIVESDGFYMYCIVVIYNTFPCFSTNSSQRRVFRLIGVLLRHIVLIYQLHLASLSTMYKKTTEPNPFHTQSSTSPFPSTRSTTNQLLHPHNTHTLRRRRRRRHSPTTHRAHGRRTRPRRNNLRIRPNIPSHHNADPSLVIAQDPSELPGTRASGPRDQIQQAFQAGGQLAVGAEAAERGRGGEMDVVVYELPVVVGDGDVALGGDGVGDVGLGGGEAVEGVGFGPDDGAEGFGETDGCWGGEVCC